MLTKSQMLDKSQLIMKEARRVRDQAELAVRTQELLSLDDIHNALADLAAMIEGVCQVLDTLAEQADRL